MQLYLCISLKQEWTYRPPVSKNHIRSLESILPIAALVASILWTLLGLYQAFGAILRAPDISPIVIFGGLRVSLISTIYGIVIYLISLIISIVQKPEI